MNRELVLTGVCASYSGQFQLDQINAAFSPGQVCAVLGPNGAGKTTLLRVIAGVLRAAEGDIRYGNVNLKALSQARRAQIIATVPQNVPRPPSITVAEAVALAFLPYMSGTRGMQIELSTSAALELCGITNLQEELCANLSSGQWRKVLIAQGIAQGTPVLLLDEPTAFLDPPAQFELLEIIRRLAEDRGTSIVMVMHDPLLARGFADNALLMQRGKALSLGNARDVLSETSLASLYGSGTEWIRNLKETRWQS